MISATSSILRSKRPGGVGVGDHEAHDRLGALLVDFALEVVEVGVAAGGVDGDGAGAAHGAGSGVGAVGVGGGEDLGALGLAALVEIRAEDLEGGVLAVGAGGGLEGGLVQAGDLLEVLAGLVEEPERALGVGVGLERVEAREARVGGGLLVDARVVLHRARAERVELRVDRELALAEVGVVAHDLGHPELGPVGRGADELGGDRGLLDIEPGEGDGARAGGALLEDRGDGRAVAAGLGGGGGGEVDAGAGVVRGGRLLVRDGVRRAVHGGHARVLAGFSLVAVGFGGGL